MSNMCINMYYSAFKLYFLQAVFFFVLTDSRTKTNAELQNLLNAGTLLMDLPVFSQTSTYFSNITNSLKGLIFACI